MLVPTAAFFGLVLSALGVQAVPAKNAAIPTSVTVNLQTPAGETVGYLINDGIAYEWGTQGGQGADPETYGLAIVPGSPNPSHPLVILFHQGAPCRIVTGDFISCSSSVTTGPEALFNVTLLTDATGTTRWFLDAGHGGFSVQAIDDVRFKLATTPAYDGPLNVFLSPA